MNLRPCLALAPVVIAACGGGGTGPTEPDPAECGSPTIVTLAPGAHQVVDPSTSGGCVRVGAQFGNEEYLVVLLSGAGDETQAGISGPFTFEIGAVGSVVAAPGSGGPGGSPFAPAQAPAPSAAAAFDAGLRRREAELQVSATDRLQAAPGGPAAAPVVGHQRTFQVCAATTCNQTNTVNATARAVGQTVAIYSDDSNPVFAESLLPADYDELVTAWDQHLHTIATGAFGAESDIDANGVVLILISRRVNDFTTSCTDGRVIGYFFGGDLLTTFAGSNRAEIFFTFAPAPATSGCSTVTRRGALNQLKPTLIHEFQHMISFNQHRLIRNGNQEQTWLNEGLSHLAEDLAGQLIPNEFCPGASSCRSLYGSANVTNAYSVFNNPPQHALVFGRASTGTLAERGAGFLFARWLLDQFGTGPDGFNLTRALVGTNLLGRANVEAATGRGFPMLAGQWLATAYVDNLAGFTDASGLLTYDTWDFRTVMDNPANSQLFPNGYPLEPEAVAQSALRSGSLKAGTGRYFLLRPGGTARDMLVSGGSGSTLQPDPALAIRLAIVRIQ